MKLSILHIADLHRDPHNPIRNQALLDSLERDRARYIQEESPRIRSPDLIIVSGDIVHGLAPGTADAETVLRRQYDEALDFLNRLAERLVGGDKQRVVIVPGNHDVSAYHFRASLQRVVIAPDRKKELVGQLFKPGSPLRWSWADFELYEISNHAMYERRFAAFAEFYGRFYEGTRSYSTNPAQQYDIFDFPTFGLTIVGFSSCYNNDLFHRQGAIHPDCISAASMALRGPAYQDRLRVGVWHHNTEGPPLESDYMDLDIVQNLIDRGFSLGFHGHQHRPQFLDTRFRHGPERRIIVLSAGTLCGGAAFRFGRAYNVVELDTDERRGLVHLREMQNDNLELPIWGPRALPPSAATNLAFTYDPPPEPLARADARTTALIDTQKLVDLGEYRKAADLLSTIAASDDLARRLLLDCLVRLADNRGLTAVFDPPASAMEAIHIMDALWSEKRHNRLRELLKLPLIAQSGDPSVIEMREKYAARLK